MHQLASFLEEILTHIVSLSIVLFEFIGVGIIIWTGVTAFLKWISHSSSTAVYLAKGLAMGLEFKMGSEILRTVIVRDWKEIGMVGGIIALRAALTILLHWEIREEEKEERAKEKQEVEEAEYKKLN